MSIRLLSSRWSTAFIATTLALAVTSACATHLPKQETPRFNVIGFFTGKQDQAHISFLHEAVVWFPEQAARNGFHFDTTSNWANLNDDFLARYQVVVFLDTRPEDAAQRAAFQRYMEHGGAWMGFHFAGFALDHYPAHPAVRGLPHTFRSNPSEWYRWEHDLRSNPDIDILLAVDSSSFPLGTGPKPHEIWHEGYYPVAWTNRKYRMIYFNFGHNDIDYEHKYDTTNKTLSHTLGNPVQDRLIVNSLLWLGSGR
ncbi:MAG: ThuA domain-containing protein [Gemmatimonadetes bacterium]|nr:ThuA domain-containing protein [Gemmatimonadota bacterium]